VRLLCLAEKIKGVGQLLIEQINHLLAHIRREVDACGKRPFRFCRRQHGGSPVKRIRCAGSLNLSREYHERALALIRDRLRSAGEMSYQMTAGILAREMAAD
jgi:hypothetical protein